MAHIGVLKVLQRERIPIDCIAGTSMGAIVGGLFALTADAYAIEREALRLQEKIPRLEKFSIRSIPKRRRLAIGKLMDFLKEVYLVNLGVTRKYLINSDKIEKLLQGVVGEKEFKEAKIAFAAVTTDLKTGEEIPIREGKMLDAILASASIPGIFPPREKQGHLLVDGGVTSLVPVDAVRQLGADVVIAVNVERGIWRKDFSHGLDILFQVDDIRGSELNRLKLATADVIVSPDLQHVSWAHFSRVKECIQQGESATERSLPQIKKAIAAKRRKTLLKRLFSTQ